MHYASPMDAARFSEPPMLSVNPAECEPRQIYKLMTGIIVPRPVALVSTINSHGVANLAPFSFFSGVGSAPLYAPRAQTRQANGKTPCAMWRRPASL